MSDFVLVLKIPFRGRERVKFEAENLPAALEIAPAIADKNGIPWHIVDYVALCAPDITRAVSPGGA